MRPYSKIVLLFVLAFLLPCFALWIFTAPGPESTQLESESELFSDTLKIPTNLRYAEVVDSTALSPVDGQEFLLAFWVRFSRLPKQDERYVLLHKIDTNSSLRQGYAITIRRDGNLLIPGAYWKDSKGQGTGYPFAGFEALPNEWYLLALSSYKHYLGFHIGYYERERGPKLMLSGGADTGQILIPDSNVNLSYGAIEDSGFRGEFGPLVIMRGEGISKALKETLKQLLETPFQIEAPKGAEILFWSLDGVNDRSDFKKVIVHNTKSNKNINKVNSKVNKAKSSVK